MCDLPRMEPGDDPPLVRPLAAGADNERHAVLPGVTHQPPGRVQVGEHGPGLAPLALERLALHR